MSNFGMAVELNGVKRGIQTGLAQGREQALVHCIKSLMETLDFTAQQAMDVLKIPKEEQTYFASIPDTNN